MTPERTLLEAVAMLHERGAQRLRVFPYRYATGHWRCELRIDGRPLDGLRYSSAQQRALPGRAVDAIEPISPDAEADALSAVLAESDRRAATRPDPAYAFSYRAMLDACGPDGVPTLFEEYRDRRREGYVRVGVDGRFPLPPRTAGD